MSRGLQKVELTGKRAGQTNTGTEILFFSRPDDHHLVSVEVRLRSHCCRKKGPERSLTIPGGPPPIHCEASPSAARVGSLRFFTSASPQKLTQSSQRIFH